MSFFNWEFISLNYSYYTIDNNITSSMSFISQLDNYYIISYLKYIKFNILL